MVQMWYNKLSINEAKKKLFDYIKNTIVWLLKWDQKLNFINNSYSKHLYNFWWIDDHISSNFSKFEDSDGLYL